MSQGENRLNRLPSRSVGKVNLFPIYAKELGGLMHLEFNDKALGNLEDKGVVHLWAKKYVPAIVVH